MCLTQGLYAQYYGMRTASDGWTTGVMVGTGMITGDVDPLFEGVALGLFGEKPITGPLSFRLNLNGGLNKGLANEPAQGFLRNTAWNGLANPDVQYDSLSKVYYNYRNTYFDASAMFQLHLSRLGSSFNVWDLYIQAGLGLFFYHTAVDAFNESRNRIYNFSEIPADPAAAKESLQELLDGSYETPAQIDFTKTQFGKYSLSIPLNLGAGFRIPINDNIKLGLEVRYLIMGNDLLDGQQWDDLETISEDDDSVLGIYLVGSYSF